MIILCSLAALGAAVGVTLSAFSDEAANSGNSLQAASSFGSGLRVATGSYTGNGADDRSLTVGFQPDVVIVKATNTQIGVMRTSTMSGDAAKPATGATALVADRIQSFGANGFTLGTNAQVNGGGTTYHWIAFKAVAGVMKVGSYTGNGSASRSITGVGYAPEYAAVLPAGAQRANHRFAGMTRGFQFDNDTGSTTRVTALDADGFTVGNNADVNTNGSTYHYITFNEVAGSVTSASYTGDNTDPRNLTGMGFRPAYAMIRANDTAAGRRGQHRPASQGDPDSLFYENQAAINTGIKSLLADGFQVGNNAAVNASGTTYHYLGFKDSP